MSRDNQIEKMAKLLCSTCYETNEEDCKKFEGVCGICDATRLYNAGYRKSTELAEEIFVDLGKALAEFAMKYSDEGFYEYFGVCEEIFTKVIYPIRKKYTEVAERRKGVENSPVDCQIPRVTDSKGETE
jgi:hypothetical protein